MPRADSQSTTTRRAVLGAFAVLAPAAVLPAVAAAPAGMTIAATGDDGELLAACAAFMQTVAECEECEATPGGWPDDRIDATIKRQSAALNRLTFLRPASAAGMRAKAKAVHAALLSTDYGGGLDPEEGAALAFLADVLGAPYDYAEAAA